MHCFMNENPVVLSNKLDAFQIIMSYSNGLQIVNMLNKKALAGFVPGAPREIRTPVLALKGLRPGPLDDGGIREKFYHIFIFCKVKYPL